MQIKIFPIITGVVLLAILLTAGFSFFTDSFQSQITQNQKLLEQILKNQRGQSLALALSKDGNNNTGNSQDYKEVEMLFRQTLREIIKEELSAIQDSDQPIYNDVAGSEKDRQNQENEITPQQQKEQQVAFEQSKTIILDAIDKGIWTLKNRDEMVSHMSNLSKEKRIEIIQQFNGAVNRGELKPASTEALMF